MEVTIFKDYELLSQQTAGEVIGLVKEKPDAVICLASGSSPLGTCQWIVKKANAEHVDLSEVSFIGLDEWVGVAKENTGSCYFFFQENLFKPLQISEDQTFLFDSAAADWQKECKKMDELIAAKSGIDLMIVGIGMNGHIGFNEPGVGSDLLSHVIDLEETTRSVGQKYFSAPTELSKGITLGLGHLLKAKKAILIASGQAKAGIIKKAVQGEVTSSLPATIMQEHPNGFVYLDQQAACLL
jgi:galactosamine-6-phosphate isomerase